MYGSSTLNIHEPGGVGGSLFCYDSSTVNIRSFAFPNLSSSDVRLRDTSVFNVWANGVALGLVHAQHSSIVNLHGGGGYFPYLSGNARLNIYGGRLDPCFDAAAHIEDTAEVYIYGSNLSYDPCAIWHEDYLGNGAWRSRLVGVGEIGIELEIYGLPDPATHPNIHLIVIPEPCALAILALGSFGVFRRQKR